MKTILVTGSGGMVGRNIMESELVDKYDVLSPSRSELDLLNNDSVMQYIESTRPDLVLHCAGRVGGIQANISNPVAFLAENTQMGLNVVLAAQKSGVKKLINLSSSCVYPRAAANPLREDYVLTGKLEPTNEGYALAKIVTAKLCEYISENVESCQYKTIIPCNLYGKYDKFDSDHSHMIPAVICKLDEAKCNGVNVVDIWGDGEARREFMYAGDFADFIVYAIDRFSLLPQTMNVGLKCDYSINEYYRKIAEVVGFRGEFKHDLSKPTGMLRKIVDSSKLAQFGWSPKSGLIEGISQTYDYYRKEICNDI